MADGSRRSCSLYSPEVPLHVSLILELSKLLLRFEPEVLSGLSIDQDEILDVLIVRKWNPFWSAYVTELEALQLS